MFELTITMLHTTHMYMWVMITYNKEKYITRIFIESLLFQSRQVDQTNSYVYLYLIQFLYNNIYWFNCSLRACSYRVIIVVIITFIIVCIIIVITVGVIIVLVLLAFIGLIVNNNNNNTVDNNSNNKNNSDKYGNSSNVNNSNNNNDNNNNKNNYNNNNTNKKLRTIKTKRTSIIYISSQSCQKNQIKIYKKSKWYISFYILLALTPVLAGLFLCLFVLWYNLPVVAEFFFRSRNFQSFISFAEVYKFFRSHF